MKARETKRYRFKTTDGCRSVTTTIFSQSIFNMAMIPDVPGPKLGPFRHDLWPLPIDFVEPIGEGSDAVVWKVRIEERLYALKIVRIGNIINCDSLLNPS